MGDVEEPLMTLRPSPLYEHPTGIAEDVDFSTEAFIRALLDERE
jgi:hypothetical protein